MAPAHKFGRERAHGGICWGLVTFDTYLPSPGCALNPAVVFFASKTKVLEVFMIIFQTKLFMP